MESMRDTKDYNYTKINDSMGHPQRRIYFALKLIMNIIYKLKYNIKYIYTMKWTTKRLYNYKLDSEISTQWIR